MKSSEIELIIKKIKIAIDKEIKKNSINNALQLIATAAALLYKTNIYYMDESLEEDIHIISEWMKRQNDICTSRIVTNNDNIVFWDGFGFNNRGLAQIYLKALGKIKNVIYITYGSKRDSIPDILKILEKNNCKYYFIDEGTYTEKIYQLNEIVRRVQPGHFFFYSKPDDVVATVLMNIYGNDFIRYQVNLTDHAFWLGARPIDICIEFRMYGANISSRYRLIPPEKIVIIPYYPAINYEMTFQGYPFKKNENQKIIFSGGSLYKTLGAGNKYYQIVDYLLGTYKEVVFWYAGSGDKTEMEKLILKYPNRIYVTEEREDLYQILKRSYFYLSTYPLCGGLMFQYAAAAQKVPLTLRYDKVTDGFLINQKKLDIQFDTLEEIIDEINKLMTDSDYNAKKGMQVKQSLVSEEEFNLQISQLLYERKVQCLFNDDPIETESFQKIYTENINYASIFELIARKNNRILFKYQPGLFIYACFVKLRERICLSHKRDC